MSSKLVGGSHEADKKEQAGQTLGRVKAVNEFLADVLEAVKDTGLTDAVAEAAPWLGAVGESLAESVAPIRFVVKMFEALTRIDDPNELGYLACRTAYQQAVQDSLKALGFEVKVTPREAGARLRRQSVSASYDFKGFSYESAAQHPFVQDAERFLGMFAKELGLDEPKTLQLIQDVRSRFVPDLYMLLSHGETREKMAPFRELLVLGAGGASAQMALVQHADYQRWLFEEMPVLGVEPFSLRQVYVDSDCGRLTWGEIEASKDPQGQNACDPFSEKHGGRKPLLDTLLDLISDPKLKDAIVIQGPAGAGKSSITLRLCWELVSQGLRPVRIALKDLDSRESKSIDEALPEAVRIDDPQRTPGTERQFFGSGLFLKNSIFDESIQFRGARICPYVLILDGWDEISIGAAGGYQQQVERMLRDIRQMFLERRSVPVRVILTGRPTEAIEKSKFLRKETVLLTLRQRTPEQLTAYVERVLQAVKHTRESSRAAGAWENVEQRRGELTAMLEHYRATWEALWPADQIGVAGRNELEVLGSPLLAHLALRLMVQWPGDIEPLLKDTTALYRNLVDMVISRGGKPEEVDYDPMDRPQITGSTLRRLLHQTAEAMTLLGKEGLSYEELEKWLQLEDREMEKQGESLGENILSRLMVSFFFQGGYRHLGCEFTHKSFREYLFAEMLVELLKQHGREMTKSLPERAAELYWQDFDNGDPRRAFCHQLAQLLGPQWMSREVRAHVVRLIAWEIGRAAGQGAIASVHSTPTEPVGIEAWGRVRDSLVDAWDWWGEGVHLRPQLVKRGGRHREYEMDKPLVVEVIESLCAKPLDPKNFRPVRTVTVDAHLGDGLLLLVQAVHIGMLEQQNYPGAAGLLTLKEGEASTPIGRPRRYQCRVQSENQEWTLFAPAGISIHYLELYFYRMLSAGGGPVSPFLLKYAYLGGVFLVGVDFWNADFSGAILSKANLSTTNLIVADLSGADLSEAALSGTNLNEANLTGANLTGASLSGADLSGSNLSGVFLFGTDLSGTDLREARLSGVDFGEAELLKANLGGALLSREQILAARERGATGIDEIDEDK